MTTLLYANNATTTLAAPINTTATVISVAPGTGSNFPSPTSGQSFRITLNDAATGLIYEILDCTARSGDSMTVSRAQEGTTAYSWSAGDKVSMFPTAGTMQNLAQNNGYGANGNWNINILGNAATANSAATATNQSGGTVNATTGAFSGAVNVSGLLSALNGYLQAGNPSGTHAQYSLSGGLSLNGAAFNPIVTLNQFQQFLSGVYGYEIFPDGTIIQWGSAGQLNGASQPVQWFFPAAFPNYCSLVIVTNGDGAANIDAVVSTGYGTWTQTFVQWYTSNNTIDTRMNYIAIGK